MAKPTAEEDAFHQEVRRRFNTGVEQLTKLIALNAPACILVSQVVLVAERARLLDPAAWARADTERWIARAKPAHGCCAEENCFADLSHECQEDRLCEKHLEDAKALAKRYRESDENLS